VDDIYKVYLNINFVAIPIRSSMVEPSLSWSIRFVKMLPISVELVVALLSVEEDLLVNAPIIIGANIGRTLLIIDELMPVSSST
jgi:hypothetical protein